MGNRAVITFDTFPKAPCIYLHWNGDLASVAGFLLAADQLGLALPDDLPIPDAKTWLMDALADMIARRFFQCPVGQNVHRTEYGRAYCDNRDNGVYIIDMYLQIVGRRYQPVPDEIDDRRTVGVAQAILQAEVAA